MYDKISLLAGIHPGLFLERELKKRSLGKSKFAISLNEYPQTLVSITKGKRRMNVNLALKVERALHLEEGFLMILQVFYDIKEEKKNSAQHPDLSKFRPALFWDTHIDMINWHQHKRSVIQRVFERGNDIEKQEVIKFYGQEAVEAVRKIPS